MRVIGISGSPRKAGNTETAVRLALEEIEKQGMDTEFISLGGMEIAPCRACMRCKTQPKCAIEDDFQPIFEKIVEAE